MLFGTGFSFSIIANKKRLSPRSFYPSKDEMTRRAWWRILHLVSTCSLFSISSAVFAPAQRLLDPHFQRTKDDRLGAVASENRVCSQIGIDLLRAGGNAADAVGRRASLVWAMADGRHSLWELPCALASLVGTRSHTLHRSGAEETQIAITAEQEEVVSPLSDVQMAVMSPLTFERLHPPHLSKTC